MKITVPFYSPPDAGGAAAAGADDKTVDLGAADAGKGGAVDDKGAAGKPAPKTAMDAGADDGADDGVKVVAPADWPENWKQLATKDIKGADKIISRFGSPVDVVKSYVELQAKVRSGKVDETAEMPDPAKDADGAKKWREERGIPAEATAYKVAEPLQKQLTDEDKPVVSAFAERALAKNWTQKQFDEGLEIYFQFADQQLDALADSDKKASEETQTALREEWGSEFRANSKLAKSVMEAIAPELINARLPDGRLVGNVPEIVKALAERGRDYFGDASFAGAEASKTTQNRLDELRKIMADEPDRWHSMKKEGFALRAEFEKLIEAEERASGSRRATSQAA